MRRAFVCLLVLLAGCEPDASNTAFRCDTDRGGQRGCPDDQSCVSGRCRRGGATGNVLCNGASCGPTDQCCVDDVNPPRCIAAGDLCPGTAAICDQRADCQTGDFCCDGETTACGASCEEAACLDAVLDCPSEAPNCCFGKRDGGGPVIPWGRCSNDPC